ncbi:CsgG/HfaB family protein [Aquimarina spongiae]|uniref:Curli production assembly/transport component CsgG n=1 Tax=Aquimarina spongiae TaxID=570521 RepID=A0A1M6HH45_9FLAO|nr:CsgG/HfaB family protein [Aquimarina spongiae]SHJ21464.1 curli production assembly/transport component CsgG [Aquimarina spongiae]
MYIRFNRILAIVACVLLLSGCGTYFNQPITVENARIGEDSDVSKTLRALPSPKEPVVVGVYKFRDQTGQYKPTEAGSTFSTAVTQGATTILIKALEDSKWFVPIERENLSNLLNERNIIRSTRKEYRKSKNPNEPQLPPLLYAGIILEGGIVSYDTNIITGGLGARYFGVGASTQYRQDRITVYLRAVSTSSGKILKTVYVSKTILSQALDANFFRYVRFRRLLEAETGFTKNEPAQLAVSEAIEKAVEALIIEGIEDKLWAVNANQETVNNLVQEYEAEKDEAQNTGLYDRYFKERRGKKSVYLQGGGALIRGDYNNAELSYSVKAGGRWYFNPYLNIHANISKFELNNQNAFSEGFNAVDLNTELTLLPFEKLSPFFFGGIGSVNSDSFDRTFFKFQYGGGIEYLVSDNIGLLANATHNILLGDELDNIAQGKRDDQYFNFSLGLNWYFDNPIKMNKDARRAKKIEEKELYNLRQRNRKVRKERSSTN